MAFCTASRELNSDSELSSRVAAAVASDWAIWVKPKRYV
jgi:hypothetical protein